MRENTSPLTPRRRGPQLALRRELVTTDNPERAKALIADAFDEDLRRAA